MKQSRCHLETRSFCGFSELGRITLFRVAQYLHAKAFDNAGDFYLLTFVLTWVRIFVVFNSPPHFVSRLLRSTGARITGSSSPFHSSWNHFQIFPDLSVSLLSLPLPHYSHMTTAVCVEEHTFLNAETKLWGWKWSVREEKAGKIPDGQCFPLEVWTIQLCIS